MKNLALKTECEGTVDLDEYPVCTLAELRRHRKLKGQIHNWI